MVDETTIHIGSNKFDVVLQRDTSSIQCGLAQVSREFFRILQLNVNSLSRKNFSGNIAKQEFREIIVFILKRFKGS